MTIYDIEYMRNRGVVVPDDIVVAMREVEQRGVGYININDDEADDVEKPTLSFVPAEALFPADILVKLSDLNLLQVSRGGTKENAYSQNWIWSSKFDVRRARPYGHVGMAALDGFTAMAEELPLADYMTLAAAIDAGADASFAACLEAYPGHVWPRNAIYGWHFALDASRCKAAVGLIQAIGKRDREWQKINASGIAWRAGYSDERAIFLLHTFQAWRLTKRLSSSGLEDLPMADDTRGMP